MAGQNTRHYAAYNRSIGDQPASQQQQCEGPEKEEVDDCMEAITFKRNGNGSCGGNHD